jgi:pimeloyl-ACP methyl ester carboxylesterase
VPDEHSAPHELAPRGRATTSDGVGVAHYDLGGTGAPVLLVHATGFCGPVFAPLATALADRGAGHGTGHALALDLRAHGRSDPSPTADFDWHGFALDVLAVIDDLGLERPVGVGHSCGGASLLLAEQARPGTFAGLYLFEPVVYPGDVPLTPTYENNPLSAGALRRRDTFASRAEAIANFSSKPPFDQLHPDALAAYVDNGFAPAPDPGPDDGPVGGITLRCRREDEAAVYAHGFAHDAYRHLAEVQCPVTLACGAETDGFGPDFLALFAARLARVEVAVLPGLGHFGPLQDPGAVAASLSTSLALSPGGPSEASSPVAPRDTPAS